MELLDIARGHAAGHRLHTPALPRPQDASQVDRCPSSPLVPVVEGGQEQLQLPLENPLPCPYEQSRIIGTSFELVDAHHDYDGKLG